MVTVDAMAEDALQPGEMKEVETNVNGSKVLIVRNAAGKYYALSPKCPHFGAPMVTGALVGNRVLCPWHNASFSISTGEPPSSFLKSFVWIAPRVQACRESCCR
jgi:nitrite reductase/ring-hydroxylating ferredoxin subunit